MSNSEDYTPIFTCEQDFERIWRRDENVKSKCFSDIADDIVANSFVFKSFRNEFETEHLFTKRCIKDLQSGELDFDNLIPKEEMKQHSTVPGYKPESFIPTTSSLTKKEMTKCFAMYQQLCKNKTLSNELLAIYNEYIANIQKEQKEYQKIVKDSWFRINKDRQNVIKPEVNEFINSFWKERLKRVAWYPKHYTKGTDISLVDACGNEKVSEMTHIRLVKHVGLLPRYNIPNLKSNINIYKDFVNDNQNDEVTMCSSYKALHKTLYKLGYNPDVSKDKIAENLASNSQAHVVISASGFLHLIDSHSKNIGKQWILPVVIKESSLDNDKKKIVFIDKALTRRSLTAVERIKWFAKIQVNKLLKSCQGLLRNLTEEDNEPSETSINDITKLETFGVDEGYKNENSPKSDSEMIINMINQFNRAESENEEIAESKEAQIKMPFTKSRLKEKISYNLWSLKNESSNMLLKSHLKTVDVLIRSKSGGKGKGKKDMFILSPKLEYQTEYGAEVVTLSEALYDWANILIRPGYKLLRARIDALTGEVIMFEQKTLQDLTKEIKRLYFNPYSRLACIQMLLGKLTEYEPGNYLLSLSPDNETFAQLYKSDNNKHTFNLSLFYQFVNPEEIAPPRANWCQIDQFVITPTFFHFHRIPAMFHPKRAKPITSKLEVREEKEGVNKLILAKRKKKTVTKKKIVQHMLKTISDSDT